MAGFGDFGAFILVRAGAPDTNTENECGIFISRRCSSAVRMYEVVMGVDGSEERAKAQSENITGLPVDKSSIRVTIVHVFADNPRGKSAGQVKSVREAADRLEQAGIEVEIQGSGGNPTVEILGIAEEVGAELISVAGRKRSPSGKAIFGSVSQSILLETDLPVMISGRTN